MKSEAGIKSVINLIKSNFSKVPDNLTERQLFKFIWRYSNLDFVVKPRNRKLVLFYRPNPDIYIEVIPPEKKETKMKDIYNNLKYKILSN